jgi:hypothetical protein
MPIEVWSAVFAQNRENNDPVVLIVTAIPRMN